MKSEFHFVIDNEAELLLQRSYYTDMVAKHSDRILLLKKELQSLEKEIDHYSRMIKRIDDHLAPTPLAANEALTTVRPLETPATKPLIPARETITQASTDLFEQVKPILDVAAPKSKPVSIPDTYSEGATRAVKAEYVLKKLNRPASTREILTDLLARDPDLIRRDNTTFDKYQKALAATLLQKVAAKNIFFSQKENDAVKYGLLEWNRK